MRKTIKKVLIEGFEPHEVIQYVMPEVLQLSRFKHDNIIKFFEHFCNKEFLFVVTEYCEVIKQKRLFLDFSSFFQIQLLNFQSGDLDQYLKKNKNLERSLVINWLKQIVSPIKYLHENNCIHRDIKPKY